MRYMVLFRAGLCAAALLAAWPAFARRGIAVKPRSPSGGAVRGEQWLFVIGINSYREWPPLKTAVNDAKAVRDALLSRYHFDKGRLIELYDRRATRRNILAKLRWLAKNTRKHDSLVIFYAGHGHLDSITKEGSWIPVESGAKDTSAWISNHDVRNYLKVDAIKAKHILLISDSCFSGDFFRGHRGGLPEPTDKVIRKAYELDSRQAITSGGLEPVVDAGFGGNSVFSHFLVKTLKENRRPFLVASALFPPIRAGVVENAEQLPALGTLRDTGGQQGGELVLFLRRAAGLEDLSARSAERQKELARLKRLEAQALEAGKKEQAAIRRKEREIAAMDKQIAQMKSRLGTSAQTGGDSLDAMLAMVEKKEAQEKRLAALKRRREAEEAKRLAEIARLRAESAKKRLKALRADIEKYKKIVSSKYGRGMKGAAWQSLVEKYPDLAKDVAPGDTQALLDSVWGKSSFTNPVGMKFVLIRPGTFMMGSPASEERRHSDEKRHKVTISKPYYVQTTEVTQAQWKGVMGSEPSRFKGCGDCPVEQVSWNDAQEFLKRLSGMDGRAYRLPTEAEWEYAARAGTGTPFHYGSSLSSRQANFDGRYPYGGASKGEYRQKTVPAASFEPNAWGLYDMHGNVWEWCEDWYGKYPSGHATDPRGPSRGERRVLRGGSWGNSAWYARAAGRVRYAPGTRVNFIGFRAAASAVAVGR